MTEIMKTLAPKKLAPHLAILAKRGTVYPNRYTGQGRFAKKSADYAKQLSVFLDSEGIDHTYANDAPRKGHVGWFVSVKSLDSVKNLIA